jgi:hypothetical protein
MMKTYKIEATYKVRSLGFFEADTEEEAIKMFSSETAKIDYNPSSLGHSISGWLPVVVEVTDAEI